MDSITLKRVKLLHPKLVDETINLISVCDCILNGKAKIRVVQGFRTFDEQQSIYDQGRKTAGKKVTNAKPGESYHNYGLAIDFCLLIDGKEISWDHKKDWDNDGIADWLEIALIFIKAGWTWGKSFNDLPHLHKTFGYHWKDLLKKYKNKEFIPQTNYVKL